MALLAVAFIAVLLAWLGWWDDIARLIPYLSVHMNTGFYLVFSSGLLIIWLAMFFIFDRVTYWRIRPGQVTEEHLIGGGAESFDTESFAAITSARESGNCVRSGRREGKATRSIRTRFGVTVNRLATGPRAGGAAQRDEGVNCRLGLLADQLISHSRQHSKGSEDRDEPSDPFTTHGLR